MSNIEKFWMVAVVIGVVILIWVAVLCTDPNDWACIIDHSCEGIG